MDFLFNTLQKKDAEQNDVKNFSVNDPCNYECYWSCTERKAWQIQAERE